MADPQNYLELVEEESSPWLLGALSGPFVGIVLGYVGNSIVEAMSCAVKIGWLKEPTSPPDVLPLIGSERRLPRYPVENITQYRNRMWHAWDVYPFAGDEDSILGQLADAGFAGAQILDASEIVMFPAGYYSQFIVYFPQGTHPITAEGPPWNSFNWGDGTRWGPVGLTDDIIRTWRGIIAQWKPSEWICRNIIAQISGWVWGPAQNWGQAGLVWGGATATISP